MKHATVGAQLAKVVFLVTFAIIPVAAARPSPPHIEYHVTEQVKTPTDYRVRTTTLGLGTTGNAAYHYTEQVLGAIAPQVRSINYATREHQRIATPAERRNLVRALLKAKVFDLVSDPIATQPTDYFGSLNLQINGRKTQVFFNRAPQSRVRKALHEIMRRFAKQLAIDKQPANAITITEGDRQPARRISLAEVIAHPHQYHGKRVSVVGYYHAEEEYSGLCVDEAAAGASRYMSSVFKSSVSRDGPSTFANKAAIKDKNDTWLRVEGIFLDGRSGHMGLWSGEIVRLTRIEPVPKPQ